MRFSEMTKKHDEIKDRIKGIELELGRCTSEIISDILKKELNSCKLELTKFEEEEYITIRDHRSAINNAGSWDR